MKTDTKPKYDRNYFIAKFSAIPADRWVQDVFTDYVASCAFGHLGIRKGMAVISEEAIALAALFIPDGRFIENAHYGKLVTVTLINDGWDPKYKQKNPRDRVLAALRDLPEIPPGIMSVQVIAQVKEELVKELRENRQLEGVLV